jgi:hypothetical protein
MSYPQHPDFVVVKNEFYPNGLKEIDIWNYYQLVKPQLLQETRFRDLIFWFMIDVNKPIIQRKGKTERFIRLNPDNYDTLITGRTVSIHSTMSSAEKFGIIDIDTDNFNDAKEAAEDVYHYVLDNANFIDGASIRFTGKSSFHIFCNYKRKLKVEYAKLLWVDFLRESELAKKYSIEAKRKPGIVNLDLAPNKIYGGFITLHSLSILGLRCMNIPVDKIRRFKKENARIQTKK